MYKRLRWGKQQKGGVGTIPTTPRPAKPMGQMPSVRNKAIEDCAEMLETYASQLSLPDSFQGNSYTFCVEISLLQRMAAKIRALKERSCE